MTLTARVKSLRFNIAEEIGHVKSLSDSRHFYAFRS